MDLTFTSDGEHVKEYLDDSDFSPFIIGPSQPKNPFLKLPKFKLTSVITTRTPGPAHTDCGATNNVETVTSTVSKPLDLNLPPLMDIDFSDHEILPVSPVLPIYPHQRLKLHKPNFKSEPTPKHISIGTSPISTKITARTQPKEGDITFDDISVFTEHVARQLRAIENPMKQLKIQQQISNILFDARMAQIFGNSQYSKIARQDEIPKKKHNIDVIDLSKSPSLLKSSVGKNDLKRPHVENGKNANPKRSKLSLSQNKKRTTYHVQ